MTFDDQTARVLCDIRTSAAQVGVDFVVVGALARDVALEAHGAEAARATLDVDIALSVSTWAEFDLVIDRATHPGGGFRKTASPHTLIHENKLPLDLVPFGHLEHPPGTVEWPGDAGSMIVEGFNQVLAEATPVAIVGGGDVAVADLPSVVFMKCFAYRDRGDADPKDLRDLTELLKARTHQPTDADYLSLLELPQETVGRVEPDGAFLTGHELRWRFTEDNISVIRSILVDVHDPLSKFVDRAIPRRSFDKQRALEEASQILTSFRNGLGLSTSPFPPTATT